VIKSIYVKDFALIDELEIHPGSGLNIITGQTGAGKSIIVGALNMILGERADTDTIRNGANKAIAEAVISINEHQTLSNILREAEIEFSNELILRREIKDGGSRAFINDTPVSITLLKQVGDLLVDLHGQHDHQLLLREENHRLVLDGLQSVKSFLKSYREEFVKCESIFAALKKLKRQEKELRDKQELYRFQLQELESAQLDPEEMVSLETEMKLLDNAEVLDQKAGLLSSLGDDPEFNLSDILSKMEQALLDLSKIEPEFDSYLQEFYAARISIQESILFAEKYRSGIEFNPMRLEFLRGRQSDIRKIEKKYTRTIDELITYCDELRYNLNLADNFDLEITKLEDQLERGLVDLTNSAVDLHEARVSASTSLGQFIENALNELGITHARFETKINWLYDSNGWIKINDKRVACTENGSDSVAFYISTNKGESPKPLSKTASGGEISRVMLALKSILAKEQSLPVMIFDEIDTGISGEVAEKVGQVMRKLSSYCQIIAITHQPQIASQAHHHFKVSKMEMNERTITTIHSLDEEAHIKEVATLMSGSTITAASIQSARELVNGVFKSS
jgi:DNA repair protein RecN (Recombination protein N)